MTSKDIKPVIEQPDTEIPLMLSQAIIVAGVLAVGELACSPLYFSLLKASLALIPWAMEAVFMAVAFTFVVGGFALLWCAESFTLKMRERFRPFAYAIVGLIGYGAWSLLVFSATINSVLAMVGERVLTNGQIGAIALNGAALGFAAFLFAKLLDVKLGNRKTTAIIMLVVEVTAAIIGLIIMILMFRALYAA